MAPPRGFKHTEETRNKISNAFKGKPLSMETRSNPQRCQRCEADPEIRGLGAELADAGTGKTGLHRSNGARDQGTAGSSNQVVTK